MWPDVKGGSAWRQERGALLGLEKAPTETCGYAGPVLSTYWVNFAKHGDPKGEGVPARPAFNDANPVVMYFGQTPHTRQVPNAESLKSLEVHFAWRRTPEGGAFVD